MSRGECSLSLTLEKAVHFMDSVVCLVQVWQNDYNPLFHYRAFLRELMHGVLVTRDSVWAIVENVSIPINGAQQSTARWANTCIKSVCVSIGKNHTRLHVDNHNEKSNCRASWHGPPPLML